MPPGMPAVFKIYIFCLGKLILADRSVSRTPSNYNGSNLSNSFISVEFEINLIASILFFQSEQNSASSQTYKKLVMTKINYFPN